MKHTAGMLLLFVAIAGYGQRIDNTSSFRDIQRDHYARIHYENDYFSTTDYYYTQGIAIEYVSPRLAKAFFNRVLIGIPGAGRRSGIVVEHEAYTPTSISSPNVLLGDRPFAAAIFLKMFSISTDPAARYRLASGLNVGAIGPVAGAHEFQAAIHRWIDDTQPQGWANQVRTDLIVNYELAVEKQLFALPQHFAINLQGGVRAGTLNTKGYGGVVLMAGVFKDPLRDDHTLQKKFQVYVYATPQVHLVAYDATLQGGLFNTHSPYVISARDISRFVFQQQGGLVIKAGNFSIEYFQSFITREFKSGSRHQWGGLRLAYGW